MNRKELLEEMKKSVGQKDPIEFFDKMVDVFSLLFDRIDVLESDLSQIKTQSALSIEWEPKVASDMLTKQIEVLKQDKDMFHQEISEFKKAYTDARVTQNYHDFCEFWVNTLGWHPFLDYQK